MWGARASVLVVASAASFVVGSEGCGPSVKACNTSGDCGSDESCLFPVGSCGAKGQCLTPSSLGAECNIVVQYCACDGSTIGGLCGPDYAFGPTLGDPAPCPAPPVVVAGSTLTTLAMFPQSAPELVTTDGKNVYFTATDLGAVFQVPVGGGSAVTLASGQITPAGIAVDATDVYWANEGINATGTIMKVPIGGGAVTTVASDQPTPFQIALDDTNVYWTVIGAPRGVMKMAKSAPGEAGLPAQLAAGDAWAITARGGTVFFTEGQSVDSVPAAGGTPTTLASGQSFPYAVAVDATHVYWTTESGIGTVVEAPIAGGTPTTLAMGSELEGIAVDADTVYFTSPGGGGAASFVASVPIAGGVVTTLATGQAAPEGIAVDATSVYWVDTQLGALMRLTPK